MTPQEFTDLATIVIYHYCDCTYKPLAIKAAKRLNVDPEDGEAAYERYENFVIEYALDRLPNGFHVRHDYWGAKIISNYTGERAPKTGCFAGDNPGRIMLFEDFAALKEYTDTVCQQQTTLHERERPSFSLTDRPFC